MDFLKRLRNTSVVLGKEAVARALTLVRVGNDGVVNKDWKPKHDLTSSN